MMHYELDLKAMTECAIGVTVKWSNLSVSFKIATNARKMLKID